MASDNKETAQDEQGFSWGRLIRLGFKNVIAFTAAATSTSGCMIGSVKLAQLLSNALLITLPKYWTYSPSYTEEDVNFYTFLAMSPLLLYGGVQGTRAYYQNYHALINTLEPSPSISTAGEKIGEHVSAIVKSLAKSPNLPVLYSTICVQLAKSIKPQDPLNSWVVLGLMLTSFSANYYCELSLYQTVNRMHRTSQIETLREAKPCLSDLDAKLTGILDVAIAADIMTDAMDYSGIQNSQTLEYASELAAIGVLSVITAYQNQKKFREFKKAGQLKLSTVFTDEAGNREENSKCFNKEVNIIRAAAQLRGFAIGGSVADTVVRIGKQVSDKNETALPAPILGILIWRFSSDVLKKYFAGTYPQTCHEGLTEALINPSPYPGDSPFSPQRLISPSPKKPILGRNKIRTSRSLETQYRQLGGARTPGLPDVLPDIPASGSRGSINSGSDDELVAGISRK